jgi:hypothetical protein
MQGEEKRLVIHLTVIDTIDRSGNSMLTDSKGLILIHFKQKGKKRRVAIHLTGIDDVDKYVTFIAHQRLPSSSLFLPSFLSYTLNHIAAKHFLGIPPLG